MQVGIIGAGKVGTTLGACLKEHGIKVTGFYSRTYESAKESAEFTGTVPFHTLEEICQSSDTLFLTVSDDRIESVWDRIDKRLLFGKMICHFSGSISSVVFSGREQWEILAASAHPVFAFHDKFTSIQDFHGISFTLEGDQMAVTMLKDLLLELGHRPYLIDSKDKEKYHAAASMASNHAVALFSTAFSLLEECGFQEEEARELFAPLILANAKNVCENGCVKALTGPIERGDVTTVKKHLSVLRDDALEVYVVLAKKILELAKKKHPEREYAGLENIDEFHQKNNSGGVWK